MQMSTPLREVELLLQPAREVGHVELTIADPPGTRGVVRYEIEVLGELGPTLAESRNSSRRGMAADQSTVCQFELPPGPYEFRVSARPRSPGYHWGVKTDDVIPAASAIWIEVLPGGRQVVTLEMLPVVVLGVNVTTGHGSWTVVIRDPGSGSEMYRRSYSAEPYTDPSIPWGWHAELPPGPCRLDLVLYGVTYSKSLDLKYGDNPILELGPGGWTTPE